jgi:DNA processing protein
MDEREAYIALNMMEKVGPVGVRAMASHLGSARAVFSADKDALMEADGIGRELAGAILSQRDTVDWQGELQRAEKAGVRLITQIDGEYPKALLEIHDPPLALYVQGSLESRDKHAIAIVGTRRATHYGLDCAGLLATQLVQAGFTIVSGLAEGIDTAAHQAALKARGRTLAVIGSGLDRLYPPSNKELAKAIVEHGAVISEFSFGREPDKTTFPIRNRIVSGLSMGVLVVEADIKSGAMITAHQALDQGRSVFAVPGRIDNAASRGTNELIKNGAKLVSDANDVLREYEFLFGPAVNAAVGDRRPQPKLSEEEMQLVSLLDPGEKDVDSLIRESGLKAATVGSLLIGLEMKRRIRMLPGRIVERIGT